MTYEVNIVDLADILQFDIPLRQFLGGEMDPVLLVRDIVVLTKHYSPHLVNPTPLELATKQPKTLTRRSALPNWLCVSLTTPQITPGKKHTPAPPPPLHARLLPKMRRDRIHHHIRPYKTLSRFLEAVDVTVARTEVAGAEVGVGFGAFLRFLLRGEVVEAGGVVV